MPDGPYTRQAMLRIHVASGFKVYGLADHGWWAAGIRGGVPGAMPAREVLGMQEMLYPPQETHQGPATCRNQGLNLENIEFLRKWTGEWEYGPD